MKMTRILTGLTVVVLASAILVWFGGSGASQSPEDLFQQGLRAAQNEDTLVLRSSADKLKGFPGFDNKQRLLEAIYQLKSGSPAIAVKEFQRVRPFGAAREPILRYAGEACYLLDHLLDSEVLFTRLAADNPGHAEAHRWLAVIARDLGDLNRSRRELEILIRLRPTDYWPHLLLGQMYMEQERYANAVKAYLKAEALHPPENALAELLTQLGRSQIQLREFAAAQKTLSRAPRSALVMALEGECLWSLDDEAGARKKVTAALERDPEQTHALFLLGQFELNAGRPEAAFKPLRRVMELDPVHSASRHQLAQALRLAGHLSEANEVASQADQITEIRGQLGILYVESFNRPNDAEIREKMAVMCDQLNQPQWATGFRKAAAVCRQRASGQQSLLKSQVP